MHTVLFKSLGLVRLKEVSNTHQGCIYLVINIVNQLFCELLLQYKM